MQLFEIVLIDTTQQARHSAAELFDSTLGICFEVLATHDALVEFPIVVYMSRNIYPYPDLTLQDF